MVEVTSLTAESAIGHFWPALAYGRANGAGARRLARGLIDRPDVPEDGQPEIVGPRGF